jgi:uncharacterized protein YodC (DUF2158 family)
MNDLTAGNVIVLKSGGPLMTIRRVEDRGAYCEWFDGSSNKGAKFSLSQLKKEDDLPWRSRRTVTGFS